MADGVVLITGGNRGIGLAIAERLAGDGENVVITTRHELPESQLAALDALGIHTVVGDVTDEAEAQRMVNDAVKHGEWLRGLINNAGINRDKLMTRMSTEDFNAVLQTNLVGAFNMSKPALKLMQKQRQGSIIHMASVVGLTGNVGQANSHPSGSYHCIYHPGANSHNTIDCRKAKQVAQSGERHSRSGNGATANIATTEDVMSYAT